MGILTMAPPEYDVIHTSILFISECVRLSTENFDPTSSRVVPAPAPRD